MVKDLLDAVYLRNDNKKLTPGGLKTRSGGINIKMRGRYFALQIRIQIGADAILQ